MIFKFKKEFTERVGDEEIVAETEIKEYSPEPHELARAIANFVGEIYEVKGDGLAKFIYDYDLMDELLKDEETYNAVKEQFKEKAV